MMGNLKRRSVSCNEEDMISNLPEHLIDSVLERLPLEEAVRTCILSKEWRYTWTTMRSLVFDDHFFKKYAKNGAFGRHGFVRIINKILILHSGPILKFVLHIPKTSLDIFEEVDQWILLLSKNGVKELILTNRNQRYELPSYLFSCLQLTMLQLNNCCFKPPPEFEGFLNLEDLQLWDMDFGANLCGTQINLPQLKKLFLLVCTNAHNFNIKATKLETFSAYYCPDAMLLRLLDSPCITKAAIVSGEHIEDFEKINLATLLSNLPKIRTFSVDSYFLKILIAEKIPKLFPHEITSLRELRLMDFQLGDLDQLHGAVCLLRNSPNLKKLSITQSEMEPRVDVGPALNHLKSPNCLDCTLNHLQTVEIKSLEGSKPELLFIKLLLAHSPSLKKFTITLSETLGVKKIGKIAKDVMRFPRASPKAKMIYLNP